MIQEQSKQIHSGTPVNTVVQGDCIEVMRGLRSQSVDFVLTDPPYLAHYCSRDGRRVANDGDAAWLKPAFAEIFRVLRRDSFCVSFYGWHQADKFIAAWRAAGFRLAGHLTFPKQYASTERFLQYRHENAYLLAKGNPRPPAERIPDVLEWKYSGNKLHPTQKPLCVLTPLIRAFSCPADIVLDPFCGSGSTLLAAKLEIAVFSASNSTLHIAMSSATGSGQQPPKAVAAHLSRLLWRAKGRKADGTEVL
jgi:site-specific DNA-methyltransferase (adenine-specific)